MPTELRIKLNEWMTNALYHLSQRIGMDYTNITRMALIEYLEKRLEPSDYEEIQYHITQSLRDAIFEFEHYNRMIKKYPKEKADKFKKLFIVALQNYKELGHTFFDKYKTNINRFKEAIWKEPGVIDLLDFMIHLDQCPLPDKDQYEDLLKDEKESEYYRKKWEEIYNTLKDRIGKKIHENYAKICELKVDYHIHTDTDMMYFLLEKLKNNEPLPPDSGHETKRLRDVSTVDEGLLEELIRKYGVDYTFIDKEELEQIGKNYGSLAQIDHMIEHFQETIKHEKNYMDKTTVEFAREQLAEWEKIRNEFMKKYQKPGAKPIPIHGKKNKKEKYAREKELARKMIDDPKFGIDKETMKEINEDVLMEEYIRLDEERRLKKRGKKHNGKKKR